MLALGRVLPCSSGEAEGRRKRNSGSDTRSPTPKSGRGLARNGRRLLQGSGRRVEAGQTLSPGWRPFLTDHFEQSHAVYLFQNGERDAAIAGTPAATVREAYKEVSSRLVDSLLETGKLAEVGESSEASACKRDR